MSLKNLIEQACREHQAGHFPQAEQMYKLILSSNPKNARVLFLLGTLHCQQNRFESAIEFLEQALACDPKMVEARKSLGNARLALGNLHKKQGDFQRAEDNYRKSCELDPQNTWAWNNLGVVLKDQNRLEESLSCYERLLKMGPAPVEIFFNLGLTLKEMGRYAEALSCYDKAIAAQPGNAKAHFNKSQILLLLEDYEKSWPEFEWRLELDDYRYVKKYVQKKWDGSSLEGKSIVVFGEQGLGDEFYYASVLGEVVEKSHLCFFECHPKSVALFQRTFPNARVSVRNLTDTPTALASDKNIDYQIPLASLMQFLRSTRESFSRNHAYLKADSQKVSLWQKRLLDLSGKLKIGIAWKTQALDTENALRAKSTTAISLWQPILKNQNCDFINLQYGDTAEDKKYAMENFGVTIFDWDDLDLTNDMDGVAALIANLDLVVSIGSAVACVAAGLGKPTWVLSQYGFGKNVGQDHQSHWLPSMKFWLQSQPGDWKSLFERVGEAVKKYRL